MLLDASKETTSSSTLVDSTLGIVFVDSPHRGWKLQTKLGEIFEMNRPTSIQLDSILTPSVTTVQAINRAFLAWPTLDVLELVSYWHCHGSQKESNQAPFLMFCSVGF